MKRTRPRRLDDDLKEKVLEEWVNTHTTHRKLGKKYGISSSSVRNIIRGKDTDKNKVLQRFEAKFEKTEGCWEWNGAKIINGLPYGLFRKIRKKPMKLAHRCSYEFYIGRIEVGLCVLHRCDNPGCVNPEHLFLGTQEENIKDMIDKGRAYWQ